MAKPDCVLHQPKSGNIDAKRERLKYLGFVVVAVVQALMIVAKIYGFAKERSGPIRPGIAFAEGTVSSALGPLYSQCHHLPMQLLIFVDCKVDLCVNKMHDQLPAPLRRASSKAYNHARTAPVAARSVMIDVKNTGMVETTSGLAKTVLAKYEPVAKDFYTKYEPVTEEYVIYIWHVLNQYLLFQRAAQAAGPLAGYCSEMYNQKIQSAAKNGYTFASHLPLIPIDRIAETLRTQNMNPGEDVAA